MTPADISPGLRKRQLSPDAAKANVAGDATIQPSGRHAPPSGRYLAMLLCSVAAAAFLLSRHTAPISQPLSSYVLCTEAGSSVYTVDASKPLAQCLVVQDGIFVDVGSERKLSGKLFSAYSMVSGTLQVTSEENGARVSVARRTAQNRFRSRSAVSNAVLS